jgi:hypothetical protein
MSVLVDTNVLLRRTQPGHPSHISAVESVAKLLESGEPVHFTLQNISEFWNVITRPVEKNGLGFSTSAALREVDLMRAPFFTSARLARRIRRMEASCCAPWGSCKQGARCQAGRIHDGPRRAQAADLQHRGFRSLRHRGYSSDRDLKPSSAAIRFFCPITLEVGDQSDLSTVRFNCPQAA